VTERACSQKLLDNSGFFNQISAPACKELYRRSEPLS